MIYTQLLPVILKILNSIFNKHPEPVSAEILREILVEYISPEVSKIGLEWNGKNQWIGPSENGIRKILKHQVGKGLMGTFIWGMCYDFLPMVSGKRIVLQRTFKSARPQLFQFSTTTDNFLNKKSDLENGVTTTWGEKECRKSISRLFEKRKNEIFEWLEKGKTIEGSIQIALNQISNKDYNTHWPHPKYVASFLFAKNGDKTKGMELLMEIENERPSFEPETFEKLKKRLLEI